MGVSIAPTFIATVLLTFAILFLPATAFAAPTCPPAGHNFPPFYRDAVLFTTAIAKVETFEPSNQKLTGITVPHHLLADRLVALGFRAASAFAYKRIVILAPDHFRRAEKLFATTTRGFETPLGPVGTDAEAAGALLKDSLFEESCLFDREHGIQAMLPFIRHYFPGAEIVPVAMSIRSTKADWDRLVDALAPLVDAETLVVESTDFSHYLPQHQARRFDQQTLNLIAAGALEDIAKLDQPDHADSVGALYVQMKLQQKLFGATPLVIANENSQQYAQNHVAETTSYMVILFGAFGPDFNNPLADATRSYYFAGDTNFGRAMKDVLLRDGTADRVAAEVLKRTRGRPLVVNLEGVILPNVPEAIDDMTLAMPADLAVTMLRKLNVAGAGLANNHAYDLGASGYAETLAALAQAGIARFGQGEVLELPGLDVVGLTDIDTNGSQHIDLLTPELLDRLVREDASKPVVAFVHWGREYKTEPSPREKMLADEMRLRGVSVIAGAHPHRSSGRIDTLAGGDVAEVYSLGNFLFDQNADRSSGALLEIRLFEQGTVFTRLLPLPNFFEMAKQ